MAGETKLDDILSGFGEEKTMDPLGADTTELFDPLDGFSDPQDTSLDDALAGFDQKDAPEVQREISTLPAWLRLNGGFGLASSLNFSHGAPETGETDPSPTTHHRTNLLSKWV